MRWSWFDCELQACFSNGHLDCVWVSHYSSCICVFITEICLVLKSTLLPFFHLSPFLRNSQVCIVALTFLPDPVHLLFLQCSQVMVILWVLITAVEVQLCSPPFSPRVLNILNTYTTVQRFGSVKSLKCLWKRLLCCIYLIKKYSKNSNVVKHNYNLKQLFCI